jgi:Dihaem cytochrome c
MSPSPLHAWGFRGRVDTLLRITDTPRWVQEHREVRAERWKDPSVKSKANCLACHKGAEQGVYKEEKGD